MTADERAMLAYVQLADVARQKRQSLGADRFLVLAGAAACRAGWLDVADRCRHHVLEDNPNHLLSRHNTFAKAMRSDDFRTFLKQLQRFCGYERAEHLLRELNIAPEVAPGNAETTAGRSAIEVLSGPHWKLEEYDGT